MKTFLLVAAVLALGACGDDDTKSAAGEGKACHGTADCNSGLLCTSIGNNTASGCYAHVCTTQGCATDADCKLFSDGTCVTGQDSSGSRVNICNYPEWHDDASLCDPDA